MQKFQSISQPNISNQSISTKNWQSLLISWLITYEQISTGMCFKGTVQRDFQPPVFFIIQTSLGHWSISLNIFVFSSDFAEICTCSIRTLVSKKVTRRGMIPRGDWLAGISYHGESCFGGFLIDSPGNDTPGDWLAGVWYPREIDTPGYDTPGRLTHRGIIPWGDWLAGVWYPGEIFPKNSNNLPKS